MIDRDSETPIRNHLSDLTTKYADRFGDISLQVSEPFPIMTYSPDAVLLREKYLLMLSKGENAVEGTRMTLDESYRSLGIARLIVECSIAIYFFTFGVDYVVACCDSSKKAFYHMYEWNHFQGTSEGDFAGLGESSTCLLGSAVGTPDKVRPRILAMAQAFRETGRICYFPNNPSVFIETEGQEVGITTRIQEKAVA